MILAAIPLIGDLLKGLFGIIDKAVLDVDKANELKVAVQQQAMALDFSAFEKEIDARAAILVAEIKGESWAQRNWRPVLMLTIVAIVANNYLVAPYLQLMGAHSLVLDLPDKLWSLMTLGTGGYIVGRTSEKVIPQVAALLKPK